MTGERINGAPPELPANRKKIYRKPQLCSYGDIRDITRAVGNFGADDGGGFPPKSMLNN